ncbi:MAG TPA: outer membrane protein assembly factor BamE [Alphaproteobacteria bacterium]|nr:outer membrane protein assembly factor BamE [Alphaproteobacteria bacterium]
MQQSHLRRFSPRTWSLGLAAVLVALGLGACNVRTDTQGNMVDAELLKQVKPGSLTKEQVQSLLGTPSSVSTFDQTTWYYIGKQTQRIAFLDPSVLDQKVVAVEFDNKGVVKAIHQYGEADGKDVDIVARTTPTRGKSIGVFDQLWQAFIDQIGTGNGMDASARDPFMKH